MKSQSLAEGTRTLPEEDEEPRLGLFVSFGVRLSQPVHPPPLLPEQARCTASSPALTARLTSGVAAAARATSAVASVFFVFDI